MYMFMCPINKVLPYQAYVYTFMSTYYLYVPMRMDIVVVFPAPLWPSKAVIWFS